MLGFFGFNEVCRIGRRADPIRRGTVSFLDIRENV